MPPRMLASSGAFAGRRMAHRLSRRAWIVAKRHKPAAARRAAGTPKAERKPPTAGPAIMQIWEAEEVAATARGNSPAVISWGSSADIAGNRKARMDART